MCIPIPQFPAAAREGIMIPYCTAYRGPLRRSVHKGWMCVLGRHY